MKTRINKIILFSIIMIFVFSILITAVITIAAPSGQIFRETEDPNYINIGESVFEKFYFNNTANTGLDDVASTIQFITLSAANENPSALSIDLEAEWEIYTPNDVKRTDGTVTGSVESAIYSPYSTTTAVDIYTWALGEPDETSNLKNYTQSSQFADGLRILRPHEYLILKITINCLGDADSEIVLFFKASEFQPTSTPIINTEDIPVEDRTNLYYQNKTLPNRAIGWWPLHNSYDPYDTDINTGHVFSQVGQTPLFGWTRNPTTTAFAKSKKKVHQIIPPEEIFNFHICGFKFDDLNKNGVHEEVEPKVDGVTITLLGADGETLAQDYYSGNFTLLGNNPEETGADGLIGHYCFNLEDVSPEGGLVDKPGTYEFYVKETLPEGRIPTTPTIIGPIILNASDGGPFNSPGNFFGNAEKRDGNGDGNGGVPTTPRPFGSPDKGAPVGGTLVPLNILDLLPLWIGVAVMISITIVSFVFYMRKA